MCPKVMCVPDRRQPPAVAESATGPGATAGAAASGRWWVPGAGESSVGSAGKSSAWIAAAVAASGMGGASSRQRNGVARSCHDGIGTWVTQQRDLVNTDVVLWHTFGTSHLPRPEDWPIMPCDYVGFTLKPVGFFDRNPALDVPPPQDHQNAHCHVPSATEPRLSHHLPVPDPKRDEGIKALIVREPGSTLTPAQIVAWCRAGLAPFKVPRYIEFRDELPHTDSGKVAKSHLNTQNTRPPTHIAGN
jgi:hypothetical protein